MASRWAVNRLFWPVISTIFEEWTAYTAAAGIKVSVNPLIFIGSAIFAWITVYISVRKPAKIAGTVSPVEAIRYTENDASAFKGQKSNYKKINTRRTDLSNGTGKPGAK